MAKALIVDDEKSVRLTLREFLLAEGHDVDVAPDAHEARRILAGQRFDVVVTDILLPGITGVELLKAIRETSPGVQVVMMTAKPTLETAAEAVRAGASDYLIKPVSRAAIVRVVATAARIKALDDERQREQVAREGYQRELEETVKRLTAANDQLRQAADFREEVEYVARHDLKAPLNVILGGPDLIRALPGHLTEEQLEWLARIESAGRRLLDMINRSLDLFKIEQGLYTLRPMDVDLLRAAREALSHNESLTRARRVSVAVLIDGRPAGEADAFVVAGERLLCLSMLGNLLKNAIEASPCGETVTIRFHRGDAMRMSICNRGAVPEHVREHFFEKLTTAAKEHGAGLGTYSARLIAEIHGARIAVDTSVPDRTTVAVTFPACLPAPGPGPVEPVGQAAAP